MHFFPSSLFVRVNSPINGWDGTKGGRGELNRACDDRTGRGRERGIQGRKGKSEEEQRTKGREGERDRVKNRSMRGGKREIERDETYSRRDGGREGGDARRRRETGGKEGGG